MSVKAVVRLFALGMVCALGYACSKAPEPTMPVPHQDANANGLHLSFATDPNPPQAGSNSVQVSVTQADGKPLVDATVTAIFYMPAMPSMSMPEMRSSFPLESTGGGIYRGTGDLVMSGTWDVTVNVVRNGEKLASGKYTVIAR
jgi:hypothetical protein